MAETVEQLYRRLLKENREALAKHEMTDSEYISRQKALTVLRAREDADGMTTLSENQYKDCVAIITNEMLKQAAAAGINLDENVVKDYLAETGKARDNETDAPYALTSLDVLHLWRVIGEELEHCHIERTPRSPNAVVAFDYNYHLYNANGELVCENWEDGINVMCLGEYGAVLVNEIHNDVELFCLSLEEARTAGIELGEYERFLPLHNPIEDQLIECIKSGDATALNVENDQYTGMYAFVEYGDAQLVYRAYEPKTFGGQEFNPLEEQPLSPRNGKDLALAGIAWQNKYYKLDAVFDPFIPENSVPNNNMLSFEESCAKYNDWLNYKLQERTGNPDSKVFISKAEYLDYCAGKISTNTMVELAEAKLVLEECDVTDWEKSEADLPRIIDGYAAEGKTISEASMLLHPQNFLYTVYIFERKLTDEIKVYDACVNDNGTLVPINDKADSFKREQDARWCGEIFFKDIEKAATKPELGRTEPKQQKPKDNIER